MPRPAPGQGIKVNFITREGETVTVEANEGESLLDLARANDLDVEGASLTLMRRIQGSPKAKLIF